MNWLLFAVSLVFFALAVRAFFDATVASAKSVVEGDKRPTTTLVVGNLCLAALGWALIAVALNATAVAL